MRFLSSVFIIVTLVSTHLVSVAQENTSKGSHPSPVSALASPIIFDKNDTIKVNLVNSIPIRLSVINDSTKLTKNDTINVNMTNLDAKPIKWQYYYYYKTRYGNTPELEDLNSNGANGWELVQVVILEHDYLVIYKKPL